MINSVQPKVDKFTKVIETEMGYLTYLSMGDKSNRTILFLHGLCGDRFSWLYCLVPLSKKFHVVAIDIPGHGLSEIHTDSIDLSFTDKWIIELTRHLKIDRMHIVAHSLGGVIASHFCIRNVELVNSLTVISPFIPEKTPLCPELMAFLASPNEITAKILAPCMVALGSDQLLDMIKKGFIKAIRKDNASKLITSLVNDVFRNSAFIKCAADIASEHRLPARTILGRMDRAILYSKEDWDSASLLVDAGHSVHLEAPLELIKFLLDFSD